MSFAYENRIRYFATETLLFAWLKTTPYFMKMLEYCQRILAKVSFDRHLFAKELSKSIKRLEDKDRPRLMRWCLDQFGQRYGDIISTAFHQQMAIG